MNIGSRMRFSFLFWTSLFSVVSIVLEQLQEHSVFLFLTVQAADFLIALALVLELVVIYRKTLLKKVFFRVNLLKIVFTAVFLLFFIYSKLADYGSQGFARIFPPSILVIVRNGFLLVKLITRLRKFTETLKKAVAHPSQYIAFSFLLVILVGTLLLLLPFSGENGGLSFVEGLFTSVSAVCVTGLSVIDVSQVLSRFGQIVLLLLIQIGGLGIMILSFFAMFSIRRKISIEDKYMLSYLLSEDDMEMLGNAVKRIIFITFTAEFIGGVFLFLSFRDTYPHVSERLFSAVFHAVSAFCNAGFSLFSSSFEGFSANIAVNLTVMGLIVIGALGFSNVYEIMTIIKKKREKRNRLLSRGGKTLSLTAGIIIRWSLVLVFSGMIIIFLLEFTGSMSGLSTGKKFLTALFQSITLRTAGFNTIPISSLGLSTIIFMMMFMFIGGASGGTAGGAKINTFVVLKSFLVSRLKGRSRTLLCKNTCLDEETVQKAFLLVFFGIGLIFTASLLMSIWEPFRFEDILFEVVSAFGTVGLSRGITADINVLSRIIIIILMFTGRVGPLTVFAAVSRDKNREHLAYPSIDFMVG